VREPNEKILFVDDDERLLEGLRRRLRRRFDLHVAVGALAGLERIASDGPYAVVVADMNMPHMDGSTFLGHVRERSPASVRMMLTGNSDLQTAVRAVNQGHVFRFISKPCPAQELEPFLTAGLDQFRLASAERRAAALEESGRAKSSFLATVSHELRTPLAGIKSAAEILLGYEDMSREECAEFLRGILGESDRLEHLLGRILRMAQLDAGRVAVDCVPFDLEHVVAAAAGGVPVVRSGAARPWRGDPAKLAEVLESLLDNARCHAPGAAVQVRVAFEPDLVRIAVEDDGPGLPQDLADRVFEPFVQCRDVLVDKPPGAGIGLAAARALARIQGGDLTYEPRPQGGARFALVLPEPDSADAGQTAVLPPSQGVTR